MKYTLPLNDAEIETLLDMAKYHPSPPIRIRGKAILLSSHKMPLQQVARLSGVCRQTASIWFNQWEAQGICGLLDLPGRGRKPLFNDAEVPLVMERVKATPRSLNKVLVEIEKQFGLKVSKDTLKRLCKQAKWSWKRVRKSLTAKRDDERFYAKLEEIKGLIAQAKQGGRAVYYFDESGFTLEPCVPYAWQPIGDTLKVPSSRSKRLNVLGFMSYTGQLESYVVEGSVTSEVVIACVDAFVETLTQDAVLIIDNAPTHTSHAFLDEIDKWADKGLTILNIPAYSPELNKIEILWRKIKYEWLEFSAYDSFKSLKDSLNDILANVGKQYLINLS